MMYTTKRGAVETPHLSRPPDHPVQWTARGYTPQGVRRVVVVRAQTWIEAKLLAAAKLGADPVTVERDE